MLNRSKHAELTCATTVLNSPSSLTTSAPYGYIWQAEHQASRIRTTFESFPPSQSKPNRESHFEIMTVFYLPPPTYPLELLVLIKPNI